MKSQLKDTHGMSVRIPNETILKMDRLRASHGNRTTQVRKALDTYVNIEAIRPVNQYGVDCDYFRKKLLLVLRDLPSFTHEELEECFRRLHQAAGNSVTQRESINEEV